ncbi:hypothetical protein E2562_013359 [Oryza meyeriana var. granulata]|uniref:Uncharacterized protein n=1 Tax=Oryza meyeriana var. granulata TaxID=110450 RepID=A0A6G1CH79_9ORYZ|nr:hypothetical protein E2562_013359 [Oryza meyeriana var. granulata]
MDPRSDKIVRRMAMIGAAYFLLTADYGPDYPNPRNCYRFGTRGRVGVEAARRRRPLCSGVAMTALQHPAVRMDDDMDPPLLVSIVMMVGMVLQELVSEKRSCQERVGSMLADIGAFANSAMTCVFLCSQLGDLPEGFAVVKGRIGQSMVS